MNMETMKQQTKDWGMFKFKNNTYFRHGLHRHHLHRRLRGRLKIEIRQYTNILKF